MKAFSPRRSSGGTYGSLLERVEILRSTLRWATKVEGAEIRRLLGQCNAIRDEAVMQLRRERFIQATASGVEETDTRELEPLVRSVPRRISAAQRRQALIDRNFVFEGVFGDNAKLLEALEIGEKAAPTDFPVLIDGESGTGKELLAKVIHANGKRADKPLISVNCGAIPDNLLESELFGHKKGAFTGATNDRQGLFEAADKGTIFLDEVGELPLHGQVKLLRVLQTNELQRLGSDRSVTVDTRIVAATNKDLKALSAKGEFREDLYYRLSVLHVTLPPLRERTDEIPLLIEFFCGEAAEQLRRSRIEIAPRLKDHLLAYSYPGNVRELRNIIFRLSCLADETADLQHLPEGARPESEQLSRLRDNVLMAGMSLGEVRKRSADAAELRFLREGLHEAGGKVVELARRRGMSRSYLQTLMKKHGLSARDFRPRRGRA
jgi:transcriptional regulator with GAF, ATPase, and Fis domain